MFTLYRFQTFLGEFEKLLSNFTKQRTDLTIIVGDFNARSNNTTTTESTNIEVLTSYHEFEQVINCVKSVQSFRIQSECKKKYGSEKSPYLGTFHAVINEPIVLCQTQLPACIDLIFTNKPNLKRTVVYFLLFMQNVIIK